MASACPSGIRRGTIALSLTACLRNPLFVVVPDHAGRERLKLDDEPALREKIRASLPWLLLFSKHALRTTRSVKGRLLIFLILLGALLEVGPGAGPLPLALSITCPTNMTVECSTDVPPAANDERCFIAQGGTISAECLGIVFVSHQDTTNNQTCPGRFTITRTYCVRDLCLNTQTCDQVIIVYDSTPPQITCPGNVTVQCASAIPSPATNTFGFIAQGGTISDNCTGSVQVTSTDVTNNQVCPGRFVITRTYVVEDGCNSPATCEQTITVESTTSPVIMCPSNITVQCASSVPAPATNAESLATQGGTISASCGAVVLSSSDMTNNQSCANRFVVVRTYTITDSCTNVASCTQRITVNDTTPPVITCPPGLIVQNGGKAPAAATNAQSFVAQGGTISENCGGNVTINSTDAAQGAVVTRTYRVTDSCGNSSTCQQTIQFAGAAYAQDFNDPGTAEVGWIHYNPTGQSATWTFTPDDNGGYAYRMIGPPVTCEGLFNRGGSYRAEEYTDFFQAVDILNNNTNSYDSWAVVGARITDPGLLSWLKAASVGCFCDQRRIYGRIVL